MSLSCGCNSMNLGELTDTESMQIIEEHFKNLDTVTLIGIGTGVTSRNFNPIATEVRKVTEKICTAGAKEKLIDTLTNPYVLGSAGLLVGLTYFLTKK